MSDFLRAQTSSTFRIASSTFNLPLHERETCGAHSHFGLSLENARSGSKSVAACTLQGAQRDAVLRRAKFCGVPVGPRIVELFPQLNVIVRKFDNVRCPGVKTGSWTRNNVLSSDSDWELLSSESATIVMSDNCTVDAVYVPYRADPCVRRNLQWMPGCFDVLSQLQRPVKQRGCDFFGRMYMIGWRFDAYSNCFRRYSPVAHFSGLQHPTLPHHHGISPLQYTTVTSHIACLSFLERRHLPNHARARGKMRKASGAPSIFPEMQDVDATTAAISQSYACDAHKDIQDKLPETIGFYPRAPRAPDWTFALPDSKVLIDLSNGPCMVYVNPQKRHATMASACANHGDLGSAIFTKTVMLGERARRTYRPTAIELRQQAEREQRMEYKYKCIVISSLKQKRCAFRDFKGVPCKRLRQLLLVHGQKHDDGLWSYRPNQE